MIFFVSFSADMGHDVSDHMQRVKKFQVRDVHRDDQTDKKQTFYQTTTLQAGPINQVGHTCF